MKITIKNQYFSKYFEGTKKEVLSRLREIARQKRRTSRQVHGLPDDIMSFNKAHHVNLSMLTRMASFDLKKLGVAQLCELLSAHGVENFTYSKKNMRQ